MSDRSTVEQAIDARVEREPEYGGFLLQTVKKLKSGGYTSWFVDCVFQSHWRSNVTHYDAAIFLDLWTSLHKGYLQVARIDVGYPPLEDANRAGNQKILDGIANPFCARVFKKQKHRADGSLSWSELVHVAPIKCDGEDGEPCQSALATPREIPVDVGSIPLEIGTTESHKTWIYLCAEGGRLARWPYGSTDAFLLDDAPAGICRGRVAVESLERL